MNALSLERRDTPLVLHERARNFVRSKLDQLDAKSVDLVEQIAKKFELGREEAFVFCLFSVYVAKHTVATTQLAVGLAMLIAVPLAGSVIHQPNIDSRVFKYMAGVMSEMSMVDTVNVAVTANQLNRAAKSLSLMLETKN